MKIELTKVISKDGFTERSVTVQMMTIAEFARFKKYAYDLGYFERVIENGKKIEKPLYRVLPEKRLTTVVKNKEPIVDTKEFRKNLFKEAKALELNPAKNIKTDNLIKLIEEAK